MQNIHLTISCQQIYKLWWVIKADLQDQKNEKPGKTDLFRIYMNARSSPSCVAVDYAVDKLAFWSACRTMQEKSTQGAPYFQSSWECDLRIPLSPFDDGRTPSKTSSKACCCYNITRLNFGTSDSLIKGQRNRCCTSVSIVCQIWDNSLRRNL